MPKPINFIIKNLKNCILEACPKVKNYMPNAHSAPKLLFHKCCCYYTSKVFTLTHIIVVYHYFLHLHESQYKYLSNTFTQSCVNVLGCVNVYIIYP